MAIIPITVGLEKLNLYMDDGLYNNLTNKVKPSVQKKDFDYVIAVDGEEGCGKSVFAMQIAAVLNPNFNIDKVCFSPNEFIRAVLKAKPYSCIVFDEAFTGLSSRAALSEINQLLVSLMMEMRQKNLFIVLVMPTFFMLDKYAVLHRAKGLFHVYLSKGRRGQWSYYNRSLMKKLYLLGKKYYEYHYVHRYAFGKFKEQYTVDEQEYRARKKKALKGKSRKTRAEAYKEQRDICLYLLIKELGFGQRGTSRLLSKWGFSITQAALSEIYTQKQKELLQETD